MKKDSPEDENIKNAARVVLNEDKGEMKTENNDKKHEKDVHQLFEYPLE